MDLVNHLEGRLLFAVPKKGRLQSAALDLLSGSDIQFRRSPRLDIALVKNLPIALIFLPAADIPTFVGEGRVDLGITGRDQVGEHDAKRAATYPVQNKSTDGKEDGRDETRTENQAGSSGRKGVNSSGVEELLDLGFGKCSLQVQVPEISNITDPRDLIGKNVVTSFTGLTEKYFRALEAEVEAGEPSAQKTTDDDNNKKPQQESSSSTLRPLKTNIIYISGSVEASCALGVADGIVDLVESGETMRAAGLTAIATVLDSTAVLIKGKSRPMSPNSSSPSSPSTNNPTNTTTTTTTTSLIQTLTLRIRGIITAQSYVLCQYNIPLPLLPSARRITPGRRAPTVTNLAEEEGWVAVSSMVPKREIAGVMDRLTECGATDVLELGIANSRV